MGLPGLGAVGRGFSAAFRTPSLNAVSAVRETAEWAKVGAMGSMLATGAAFEIGVVAGSYADAKWFHPCAKTAK